MPRARRLPSLPSTDSSETAAFRRLDNQDRLTILRAKQRHPGMSMEELGDLVGCSKATVYRVIHAADRPELELLIRTSGPHVVDRWLTAIDKAAEKGYHQPARDFLAAGQLIAPPTPPDGPTGRSITVNLAFALPGVPNMPAHGGTVQVDVPALEAPADVPLIAAPTPTTAEQSVKRPRDPVS